MSKLASRRCFSPVLKTKIVWRCRLEARQYSDPYDATVLVTARFARYLMPDFLTKSFFFWRRRQSTLYKNKPRKYAPLHTSRVHHFCMRSFCVFYVFRIKCFVFVPEGNFTGLYDTFPQLALNSQCSSCNRVDFDLGSTPTLKVAKNLHETGRKRRETCHLS